MSNKSSTQRREEKLAKELRVLAVSSPKHLKFTWEKLLEGWSLEAIRRGRLHQQDNLKSHALPVFDVLSKAERLLALCGQEVERLVGTKTRELLSHDCSKAFAFAVDPNMYHLSVKLRQPKPREKVARTNPSTSTQGD